MKKYSLTDFRKEIMLISKVFFDMGFKMGKDSQEINLKQEFDNPKEKDL